MILVFANSASAATWDSTTKILTISDSLPMPTEEAGAIEQIIDASEDGFDDFAIANVLTVIVERPAEGSPGVFTTADLKYILDELGNDEATLTVDLGAASLAPGEEITAADVESGKTKLKSIILPLELKEIADDLFADFEKLETVVFPPSLTSIGNNSFKSAAVLRTVDFSAAAKLKSIGASAFEETAALKTLDLSVCDSLERIGGGAFKNATSLKTVNLSGASKLTKIGESAFEATGGVLETVNLSGCTGIKEIGDSAFKGQRVLALPDLSDLTSLVKIGANAFEENEKLAPEGTLNLNTLTGLVGIGQDAFKNTGILKIKLPLTRSSIAGLEKGLTGDRIARILIPESLKSVYETDYESFLFDVGPGASIPCRLQNSEGAVTGWLYTYNEVTGLQNVSIARIGDKTLAGYTRLYNSDHFMLLWNDGSVSTTYNGEELNLKTMHYIFDFGELVFVNADPTSESATPQFLARTKGTPIPTGTELKLEVTQKREASTLHATAIGDKFSKTATVEEADGRSTIIVDLNDVPNGVYSIAFTSDPIGNPVFKGVLASDYVKNAEEEVVVPTLTLSAVTDADDVTVNAAVSPTAEGVVLTFTLLNEYGAVVTDIDPQIAATNSDGLATAAFSGLPDGNYTVQASAEGYATKAIEVTINTAIDEDPQLSVNATSSDDDIEVNAEVSPAVPNVELTFTLLDENDTAINGVYPQTIATDMYGKAIATFSDLPDGNYKVQVTALGYETAFTEVTLNTSGVVIPTLTITALPATSDEITVFAEVSPAVSEVELTFTLLDESGSVIIDIDPQIEFTNIDGQAGAFFSDLPDGKYTVEVFAEGYETASVEVTINTSNSDNPPNPVTPTLTVTAVSPASDDITVKASVSPVTQGVGVTFSLLQSGVAVTGITPVTKITDINGTANATFFDLPDGKYTVRVTATGYATKNIDVTIKTSEGTPTPEPGKKSSSSGGCDAGFSGLILLLAAPLFLRKKN
jgi:Synergist-CTERM protein sorting domain-containing protein